MWDIKIGAGDIDNKLSLAGRPLTGYKREWFLFTVTMVSKIGQAWDDE